MSTDILGLVRFCMVLDTPRGFPSLLKLSREEREAIIFSESNLNQRLSLLENVLLPSLNAQSDPDFKLAVMCTSNLPRASAIRLAAIVERFDFAFIVEIEPQWILKRACRIAMRRAKIEMADRWATFRIDDDDALSRNYIRALRGKMEATERSCAVTMTPGLEVVAEKVPLYRRDTKPCSGAGLAMIALKKERVVIETHQSVYQLGPHRNVEKVLPLSTIDDDFAFLRLIHDKNISGATAGSHGYLDRSSAHRILRETFAIENPSAFESHLMSVVGTGGQITPRRIERRQT